MPPLSPIVKQIATALGKQMSNLKNIRWVTKNATVTAGGIWVIGPLGKKAWAVLTGHFHHDEGKLGDHYTDEYGNEYAVINGKKYRHDRQSDVFYSADTE